MKTSNRAEWVAFAGGLAIAAVLWLWIHGHREGTAAGSEVQVAEAPVWQADKPSAAKPGAAGTESGRPKHTGDIDGLKTAPNGGGGANGKPGNSAGETATGMNRGGAQTLPRPSANGDAPGADRTAQNAQQATSAEAQSDADLNLSVSVYLTKERRIERVPLETYVRGVVAGEMPADFEPAALEAQALAARTYIVRRLLLHDDSGVPVPDADVTDTQTHQVYLSQQAMNRLRTENEQAWRKADEAAARTAGTVIAYRGEPIQALYFSTSNGFTENSEDVFPARIPYLRSVASPWDRTGAPRSQETVALPLGQFYAKLGIRTVPVLSRLGGYPKIKIAESTTGKRVKTLTVGGKSFTGQEIRSKLGLRSSSFSWSVKDGEIRITTFGSGHGVGMSQWGAQGMALAGRTAEDIVKYYYTGTELMKVSKLAEKL